MPAQAYALKESADDFAGGSVATRNGETVNVGQLLQSTKETVESDGEELSVRKGYIVTEDPLVIEALDGYAWLKHTTLKDALAAKRAPRKQEEKDEG